MEINEKINNLKEYLATFDALAVAFSGGVDSTFLLLVAKEVPGLNVLAVTVTGPNFAPDEIEEAKQTCKKYEIPHLLIPMPDEVFKSIENNPIDRCYICKRGLFQNMKAAIDFNMTLVDGTNADDNLDYRPGIKALKELGIISPLEELRFTKEEVREGLKAMNIAIWNKPAYACLASRIPYGEKLTIERLHRIYILERFIRDLGFRQVRVRDHGDIAIVEVPPEERELFSRAVTMDVVEEKIKSTGFRYATLDLGGYKIGKLNDKVGK